MPIGNHNIALLDLNSYHAFEGSNLCGVCGQNLVITSMKHPKNQVPELHAEYNIIRILITSTSQQSRSGHMYIVVCAE